MSLKPKPYLADVQGQFLKDHTRIFPCHTNRASECGHPCARYLVYCRTHWRERTPHPPTTQAIFELGKELERVVVQGWLQDRLGLEVVAPKHADFSYPAVQLTGHLDCYIEEEVVEESLLPTSYKSEPDPHGRTETTKIWVPCEVKGVARGTWNEINKFGDLLRSKRSWVRKWAGQLLVYMLMDNKPFGRFIFFSKETGQIKDIPVRLEDHLEYAEEILRKLEVVNKHVEEGTLPDRFYEPGAPSPICEDCGFNHTCLPGGGYTAALSLVDDPVVEESLDAYFILEEEYERAKKVVDARDGLRKKIRGMLNNKENCIIGKYHVTGKMRGGRYPYWQWEAKRLGSEADSSSTTSDGEGTEGGTGEGEGEE